MTLPQSGSSQSGSFHAVTDAEQARLLTDPRSRDFFKPFLARERGVTQAAAELGCSLSTLLYRVRTFVRAGLLQVSREERRAGRAIKHYRSVHDAYFVPFRLTPHATLEERLSVQAAPIFGQLIRAYASALTASDLSGQHLLRDQGGVVWTTDFPPDFTPPGLPVVYFDTVAHLPGAEAQELGQDLKTLFGRGTVPQRPDRQEERQAYMLMVALLPLSGEN